MREDTWTYLATDRRDEFGHLIVEVTIPDLRDQFGNVLNKSFTIERPVPENIVRELYARLSP